MRSNFSFDESWVRRYRESLNGKFIVGQVAAFDLFALPSLRERFGSILVDAMQFGLPVVASAVGGIPDIVVDAETGVLVPPGDAAALAVAIASLNTGTELRNAMSEAARRRARDYRPEFMIERYWELYQELLPRLAREH